MSPHIAARSLFSIVGHSLLPDGCAERGRLYVFTALILVAAVQTGCQTARYVVRDPDRGVVAIPSDGQNFPNDYRQQAALLMADHFPDGYRLTGEEYVSTGPDRTYHENLDQVSEGRGPLHILGRSTIGYGFKRDRKEIHISYERLEDEQPLEGNVPAESVP